MQVKIIDNTNPTIVKKMMKKLLREGWKKGGELEENILHIKYKIEEIKTHKSKVYSQKLIKEDLTCH